MKQPVLIASHDAGGADVLMAWAKTHQYLNKACFCLSGPAKTRFTPWLSTKNVFNVDEIDLSKFNTLITSTSGYGVKHEKALVTRARQQSLHTITLLDHWTNYPDRFELNGEYIWPDDIIVFDAYAENLIHLLIEEQQHHKPTAFLPKVHIDRNYFLEKKVAEISQLEKRHSQKNNQSKNILYVTEPSTDSRYHEIDVLHQFLSDIPNTMPLFKNLKTSIRIRPHPKEPDDKYSAVLNDNQNPVEISQGVSLAEDIAWADIVVGCQTMAMVVALQAGKKVFCSLPSIVEHCALPHSDIVRIHPHPNIPKS